MEHTFREALSSMAARVVGSRFAKPIARVLFSAAGLLLLAFIGRTAVAGAIGKSALTGAGSASVSVAASALPSAREPVSVPPAVSEAAPAGAIASTSSARGRASPDDPVILNIATEMDLRRLPGIGPKRADAIVALRAHLGRFRAVEDLLKVKGIGRATLKRLRPLVRVDAPPMAAGSPAPVQAER